MNPRVLKESGFKHLDRVIELCAAHKIYTILDLHTAPGTPSLTFTQLQEVSHFGKFNYY
jgi:hypothetical protein